MKHCTSSHSLQRVEVEQPAHRGYLAAVTQLGECQTEDLKVAGSSPACRTSPIVQPLSVPAFGFVESSATLVLDFVLFHLFDMLPGFEASLCVLLDNLL